MDDVREEGQGFAVLSVCDEEGCDTAPVLGDAFGVSLLGEFASGDVDKSLEFVMGSVVFDEGVKVVS